jgi:hypothetical protein
MPSGHGRRSTARPGSISARSRPRSVPRRSRPRATGSVRCGSTGRQACRWTTWRNG